MHAHVAATVIYHTYSYVHNLYAYWYLYNFVEAAVVIHV